MPGKALFKTTYSIVALLLFAGCGAKSDDTGGADRDPDAGMYDDATDPNGDDTGVADTSADDTAVEYDPEDDDSGGEPEDLPGSTPDDVIDTDGADGEDEWGGRDTGVDTSAPATACNDGEDNDGDGWVDVLDPDCERGAEEVGYGDAVCNDGVDNDGDGLSDGDDPECVTGGDTDESYR